MRKLFVCLGFTLMLASLVLACGTTGRVTQNMTPGTYTASVVGFNGPIVVEVTVSATSITGIRVADHAETPWIGDAAIGLIPARIMEHQSLAVDIVSGSTLTSRALLFAVEQGLNQAGANMDGFRRPIRAPRVANQNLRADVIIVGGGGAGLAAAISATDAGASVILIEKEGFLGGNTVAAGGIFNVANSPQQSTTVAAPGDDMLVREALAIAPISEAHRALTERVRAEFEEHRRNSNLIFDSPAWFALQSWIAGDMVANLDHIYLVTSNSLDRLNWLRSMGMEFQDGVTMGAGSLYRRTLRAALPNGVGYLEALTNTLAGRPNFSYHLNTRGTGLIMEGDRVVGVDAVGRYGNRITLRANNGVILATGGFAGNVALRQQYAEGSYAEGRFWPYLGSTLNTSNLSGVTGDGIFWARDAGAQLIDMEHIQLLHNCNPWTGTTGDITSGGHGIAGTLFFNQEGHRFVREDGRRDVISQAILAQTGAITHQIMSSEIISNPHTARTLDGRTVAHMVEHNLAGFVTADTLRELTEIIGVNYDNVVASLNHFNQHARANTADSFDRVVWGLTVENGPWFSYPRAPAAHHTMGGVRIDQYARALRADGTPIPGLFTPGEIAGGIHGSNRLGGNALVDIMVFGKIAGQSAAAGR